MSRSSTDFLIVTAAFGCAFARMILRVNELVAAETLAAIFSASVFSAYRITMFDAVAR